MRATTIFAIVAIAAATAVYANCRRTLLTSHPEPKGATRLLETWEFRAKTWTTPIYRPEVALNMYLAPNSRVSVPCEAASSEKKQRSAQTHGRHSPTPG